MTQTTKPIPHPLHVVTMVSNPRRFRTRYALYQQFAKHVRDSGGVLHAIELSFGDRPFELDDAEVQLRTDHELWHKERAQNLMVQRLPADAKYLAFVDADVAFARSDWVAETLHMLQHHPVVQPWSIAHDLLPNYEPFQSYRSFAWCHQQNLSLSPKTHTPADTLHVMRPAGYYASGGKAPYWHPGYAWAFTREAFEDLGGLIDWAVIGAGDHHMAMALAGRVAQSVPAGIAPRYLDALLAWQARADRYVQGHLGYVEGSINHYWHGRKALRKYIDRWQVLTRNDFDPLHDLKPDWTGLYQITERKPQLVRDLQGYFSQRNEDGIDWE